MVIETSVAVRPVAPAGTAIRDAATAGVGALMLCAAVAGDNRFNVAGVAGALLGTSITAVAGLSVVARPGRWSGPADRVTLARAALIAACATISVQVAAGALPERAWQLVLLLAPALALDAVDGAVARITVTSSAAGARLDAELDAAVLLVLSIAAVRALGWWVLAIGLMRYAFWAAGYVRPQQRGQLPPSQFRRGVAALQGIMFAIAMAPIVPLAMGAAGLTLALALLIVSFGHQVIALERAGPIPA